MTPIDLKAERERVLGLLEAFNKADAEYERACEASGDNPTPEQRWAEELADEHRDGRMDALGYPPLILGKYADALAENERLTAESEALEKRRPISHAIKAWGEEMRELMAAFERHVKASPHVTIPRLDREAWKERNGSYYQNGEANSLFQMFMAGYQSAKPGWLNGHYADWHAEGKARAALAPEESHE